MKEIQQAGGIVLNSKGAVLIITSRLGRKTFPKGSREAGETTEANACREIEEETGLKNFNITDKLGVLVRPGFTADNTVEPSVIKHIDMFLCVTEEFNLEPQDPAITKAEWVDQDSVAGTLSWAEEAGFFKRHRAKLII